MQVDLRVVQLLCSRVCHDLIGPVGAVNTGLELMAEEGSTGGGALELVTDSAATVANRLAFFRTAFGLGGGTGPTAVSEARGLAFHLLAGGKITLDWPEDAARAVDGSVAAGGVKLLLCFVFLAAEMLPRGGQIAVRTTERTAEVVVTIAATGTGARVREGVREAMFDENRVDELTVQTVAAHFTSQLARFLGVAVELTAANEDEVLLAASLPSEEF